MQLQGNRAASGRGPFQGNGFARSDLPAAIGDVEWVSFSPRTSLGSDDSHQEGESEVVEEAHDNFVTVELLERDSDAICEKNGMKDSS